MSISRTHRPRQFKDVTGQEHITETLRREVVSDILGHAFLFSGPRGIGKTTTARIFAKALLNEETNEGEPPQDSDVSKEIDEGKCIDLIEIDAASHTGVENVREAIIEHVRFAPARWKRKVYIIDECHMLSASAWNAMLKTLEEPPPYAFFILATTELHKVPETIKSRCQRFEFRRVLPEALKERLKALAKTEKLSIDDEVIRIIVHASDGCVRDAESLLDQLSSIDAKKITKDIARLILPASRIPQAAHLLESCATRDVALALTEAKKLTEDGIPPSAIIDDLLAVVRMLIIAEDPAEAKRLSEGDEGERGVSRLIGTFDRGERADMALLLMERRRDLKTGSDPMFIIELVVLAIAGSLLPHAGGRSDDGSTYDAGTVKKDESKTNVKQTINKTRDKENVSVSSQKKDELTLSRHEPCIDLHELRKHWNQVISEVEKENRSIPFILKICRPETVDGHTVYLKFEYSFHREKLIEDIKTKRIVEQAIRTIIQNESVIIDGLLGEEAKNGDRLSSAPQDVVSKVLNTFGGQVVE